MNQHSSGVQGVTKGKVRHLVQNELLMQNLKTKTVTTREKNGDKEIL